jgi:hypothetical protein
LAFNKRKGKQHLKTRLGGFFIAQTFSKYVDFIAKTCIIALFPDVHNEHAFS